MKRERNQKDTKTAKSQTKSVCHFHVQSMPPTVCPVAVADIKFDMQNEKACSIQCQVCRQTFLQTTKPPAYVIPSLPLSCPYHHEHRSPEWLLLHLTNEYLSSSLLEHASNKHNKGLADCFPGISA
jgi:hypothetical protein